MLLSQVPSPASEPEEENDPDGPCAFRRRAGCQYYAVRTIFFVVFWELELTDNSCQDDFSLIQLLSHVQFLATPRDCSTQSITSSRRLLKLLSIKSLMPSNHLILCRPLLLPPSVFPSIRVFSDESLLHIRWPSIGVSASALDLPKNIQD